MGTVSRFVSTVTTAAGIVAPRAADLSAPHLALLFLVLLLSPFI